MDDKTTFETLMDLAEETGMTIRMAPAGADSSEHPGGAVVRLKGKEMVFLDSTAGLPDQIAVLAEALAGKPQLQERFLPPHIRVLLERQ